MEKGHLMNHQFNSSNAKPENTDSIAEEKMYISWAKVSQVLRKYSFVFKTLVTFLMKNSHLTVLCQHPQKAELPDSRKNIPLSKTSISVVTSKTEGEEKLN